MLEQREAFLTTIFDKPDDALPRLAYADWLDDRGEFENARVLRLGVELESLPDDDILSRGRLAAEAFRLSKILQEKSQGVGFTLTGRIDLAAERLQDAAGLRVFAAEQNPGWFGETTLKIISGRINGGIPIETLFSSPAFARITTLDFAGIAVDAPVPYSALPTATMNLFDTEEKPVITTLGVEALAKHRGAKRIQTLLLSNNGLDNDAARMLVKSPFLNGLTRLDIRNGNQLRGSTWSELLARFGEQVVE
jgi:uncharacterized protein (TIGR02996 family)